jgi:predicted ATPase
MRLDMVRIAFGTAPLREGHIISRFTELIVPSSYVSLAYLAISHSTNPVPCEFEDREMLDSFPHDFRATQLDPDLLSSPFGVQTNWHVITGTVCSGKTTLIDQLAAKGFQTVPEIGRQCFERELAKGRTIDEIRENGIAFQRGIIDMQLRIEGGLRAIDVLFLDRALPDTLAHCRVVGLNPNEFLPDCFQYRYASVFWLDQLPYQQEGRRIEDDATAGFLDEWLARDYRALGYSIVRVPVLPPQERLAFVLETLSEQELI